MPTGRKKTILTLMILLKRKQEYPLFSLMYSISHSIQMSTLAKKIYEALPSKGFNLIKYQSTLITVSLAKASGLVQSVKGNDSRKSVPSWKSNISSYCDFY